MWLEVNMVIELGLVKVISKFNMNIVIILEEVKIKICLLVVSFNDF